MIFTSLTATLPFELLHLSHLFTKTNLHIKSQARPSNTSIPPIIASKPPTNRPTWYKHPCNSCKQETPAHFLRLPSYLLLSQQSNIADAPTCSRTPAGMVLAGGAAVAAYLFTQSNQAKNAGGMENFTDKKGLFTETSPAASNSPGGPSGSNRK